MIKNLIVGCGITGITLANRIVNELQEEVLIIDKRNHIGGNCYDYLQGNIYIHKYGAHIFHTNHQDVWHYLSNFTKWHYYMHKVKAIIDGIEIPIPFNLNSLYLVFSKEKANKLESVLINTFGYGKKISILELKKSNNSDMEFLAEYIYNKIFLGYTIKQWGLKPEELDYSVTSRVPINISKDDRYFQDKYQGIPLNGYTNMFKNMLNNPLIKIKLKTNFNTIKHAEFDKIYYTGAIDEYYNYKFGELPYRSLKFDLQNIQNNFYQSNSVVNYPENYDFTRIIEYKHFHYNKSNKTVICVEYPQQYIKDINDRYYPIINNNNMELYNKYKTESLKDKNIVFLGRLGDYSYYNMDNAVKRVLDINLK